MFKRVLYTGLGAGAGAALCYPDEASEVTTAVYQEGRKTAQDAYSLMTGGKLFPLSNNCFGDSLFIRVLFLICLEFFSVFSQI